MNLVFLVFNKENQYHIKLAVLEKKVKIPKIPKPDRGEVGGEKRKKTTENSEGVGNDSTSET